MPQLPALEECLGTSSGEGGLTIEGIEVVAFGLLLLLSEKRPLFFLASMGAGAATKLEAVGRDGPAAAQKDSAMVQRCGGYFYSLCPSLLQRASILTKGGQGSCHAIRVINAGVRAEELVD